MASVFLFSFASAYSWRTIVFHVFLFCSILAKKTVLSSSIYCANWPHLFGDFYPWTSSIFPSAVHCLDISPDFPGFVRFFNSLFTMFTSINVSTNVILPSAHLARVANMPLDYLDEEQAEAWFSWIFNFKDLKVLKHPTYLMFNDVHQYHFLWLWAMW